MELQAATFSDPSGYQTRRAFAPKIKGVITKMNINRSSFGIACRAAAFSFLLAGSASLMRAQQAPSADAAPKAPVLLASNSAPLDLSASSSSSSSDSASASGDNFLKFDALDSSQPPPRRRYGNPNYSDSHSNADGSPKFAFIAGGGLTLPVGITHKYETPSYDFQVGGGRNFSKSVGVLLQFDYDHFGLQGATLANEGYIYNYCTTAEYNAGDCSPLGAAPSGSATPIDGNNHVWSFTLDPTFTLATEGTLGAYAVVGGGFYHKVTNFTTPTVGEYCYYYCEEIQTNATFDHYTSNAGGVNAGIGLTWKFAKFSNQKFYAEARYVVVFDSQRTGVTTANVGSAPLNASNFYPANSDRTTYVPVTFGIRF
jgi:hypothetical protein